MKSTIWRGLVIGGVIALCVPGLVARKAHADSCGVLRTQGEITACFGDDEKAADSTLNKLYQSLMPMLSDDDAQRLRDAQRAWISFRDKECAFRVTPFADGSIAPSLTASCVTTLTAQRVLDLRHQMSCQEGDMSCVPHMSAATGNSPRKPAQKPMSVHASMDKGACSQAVGLEKAREIAGRCLEMSSASHPPCNVENSCNMMIEEIRQGCAGSGADAPKYCASYH